MTMTPRQETAKIYQFPLKTHATTRGDRRPSRGPVEACPVVGRDFGSGWYHEAAMQESTQGRTH